VNTGSSPSAGVDGLNNRQVLAGHMMHDHGQSSSRAGDDHDHDHEQARIRAVSCTVYATSSPIGSAYGSIKWQPATTGGSHHQVGASSSGGQHQFGASCSLRLLRQYHGNIMTAGKERSSCLYNIELQQWQAPPVEPPGQHNISQLFPSVPPPNDTCL
jgi:hypothetical protein